MAPGTLVADAAHRNRPGGIGRQLGDPRRAIADAGDSAGWQHMNSRSSVSSRSVAPSVSAASAICSSGGTRLTTSASRWRRAASART